VRPFQNIIRDYLYLTVTLKKSSISFISPIYFTSTAGKMAKKNSVAHRWTILKIIRPVEVPKLDLSFSILVKELNSISRPNPFHGGFCKLLSSCRSQSRKKQRQFDSNK
jgi:hypothetical protein